MDIPSFRLRAYGPRAVLATLHPPLSGAQGTAAYVGHVAQRMAALAYVEEAIAAYDEVLLTLRQSVAMPTVRRDLRRCCADARGTGTGVERRRGRRYEFHVRYDGPDLGEVAVQTGLSREEVISKHSNTVYTVRAVGFQPGFAYLGTLPEGLRLARRSSPRPHVPPGSVAIAMDATAVYPHASPGGWHLIGRLLGRPAVLDLDGGEHWRVGDSVAFVAQ